ncbi:hypothetical protein ACP4OV_025803 [Aristida adscensionis]
MAWDRYGKTDTAWAGNEEASLLKTKFGISTPVQALARVGPLLRGKKCTWTPLPPPPAID